MTQLHIVPEVNEANGVWRVASLLSREQGGIVMPASAPGLAAAISNAEEVWVHGAWLPRLWRASLLALRSGKRLVRMTHGSLSPIYLRLQSPLRKRLVSPIERFLLRRADRVVATCPAEAEWIRAYEPGVRGIGITDIKRFFDLSNKEHKERKEGEPLHLLYLGRRHPLKGLQYLEEALRQCGNVEMWNREKAETASGDGGCGIVFRVEDGAFGVAKEAAFDWCDVLALPSLSENFGLVVAEALERGRRVIVTDGAPAWDPASGGDYGGRLIYMNGFMEGAPETRTSLLREALKSVLRRMGTRRPAEQRLYSPGEMI